MNARSRVLGVLAATIIALSMFGGATAQQYDQAWGSAELTDSQGNFCTVDIYMVDGSFGTWDFDGSQYNPTGPSRMTFWTAVNGGGTTGCNVSVYFSGLYGPGYIDPSNFSAYSWFRMGPAEPSGFGDTGVLGSYDFDYTLDFVPSHLTPGWYEGWVDVYVSNTI